MILCTLKQLNDCDIVNQLARFEFTLLITEAIKPSTTTSSFVDPSYDYPLKGNSKRQ